MILEEAHAELHQLGYLPRVKRSHKADLRRLAVCLRKGETLVLRQRPDHARD